MNQQVQDIYSHKITSHNTDNQHSISNQYSLFSQYSKANINNTNINKYIKTKDLLTKQNMYEVQNPNLNFYFHKYQNELIVHNENDNKTLFNSCIYSPNYKGELGCNEKNKNLHKEYFKSRQYKDYKFLKSIDKLI